MRCNSCGNEVPNGSTVCPFCNSEIKSEEIVDNEIKESGVTEVTNEEKKEDNLNNTASYIMDATGEQPVINPTIEEKPKKKKTGLIVGIVIGIIALIIVALGVVGYFFEFKSADKRITNVLDNTFKKVVFKNEKIEKSSGKFDIDGKVSFDSQSYSAKLEAKYGVDLLNKFINLDMNISSINLGMELLDEPLKVNTYLTDSSVYALFSNFYDKYVYTKVEGMEEIFDAVEQNDIDYKVILDGFKEAMKASMLASTKEQSVKNGKNIIKIVLNKDNQKKMTEAAKKSILNNDKFLTEFCKLTNQDIKELKASLEKYNEEYKDTDGYIEIVTNLLGNELIEFNIKGEDITLNIKDGNIVAKIYQNEKLVCDLNLSFENKKSSKIEETTAKVNATCYINNKAYTVELNIKVEDDVNPSVEKVDLKGAVNIKNISQEDVVDIYTKVSKFGKLGLFISQFANQGISSTENQITAE